MVLDPVNLIGFGIGGQAGKQAYRLALKEALKGIPAQDFKYPKGIVKRRVNWDTQLLVSTDTPEDAKISIEKYWKGSEPTEFDTKELISKMKKTNQIKEEEDRLQFVGMVDLQTASFKFNIW